MKGAASGRERDDGAPPSGKTPPSAVAARRAVAPPPSTSPAAPPPSVSVLASSNGGAGGDSTGVNSVAVRQLRPLSRRLHGYVEARLSWVGASSSALRFHARGAPRARHRCSRTGGMVASADYEREAAQQRAQCIFSVCIFMDVLDRPTKE